MIFGVQWYYLLVLAIAIIVAIVAWSKALGASRARREKLKKEAAIWKRDYELREKYSVLTEEKFRECDNLNLLHAVAMNIQVQLENAIDMNKSFDELPTEKKHIYALEYFDEDAKESLSTFFKNNGAPLVPNILQALTEIGETEVFKLTEKIYPMYDPDSEVSIDYAVIQRVDEQFMEIYDSRKFCLAAAEYIRKNKDIFLSTSN
jgi:hypothetical protein